MTTTTARRKFVVGTLNGKSVAFLNETPQDLPINLHREDQSKEKNLIVTPMQEDEARINGTVTLSNQQLRYILDVLRQLAPSAGGRILDSLSHAWIPDDQKEKCSEEPISNKPIELSTFDHKETTSNKPSKFDEAPQVLNLNQSSICNHPSPLTLPFNPCNGHTTSVVSEAPVTRKTYSAQSVPSQHETYGCHVNHEAPKNHSYSDVAGLANNLGSCVWVPREQSCSRTPKQSWVEGSTARSGTVSRISSASDMKPPSLLEQKKKQWAKEREELDNLCAPWGKPGPQPINARSHEASPTSALPVIPQEEASMSYPCGYTSTSERDWGGSVCVSEDSLHLPSSPMSKSVRFTPRTPGEGEEEERRPRWGDRGVGVGHLWEPATEPTARLPDPETPISNPAWLERGLSRMGHSIERTSPEPRSYLRGQNVPMDPQVLEERETRRQKALEHQKAIRQQLEDREKHRREERERRQREERLEEERIKREQEREAARLELERKREKEAREVKQLEMSEKTEKIVTNKKVRASRPVEVEEVHQPSLIQKFREISREPEDLELSVEPKHRRSQSRRETRVVGKDVVSGDAVRESMINVLDRGKVQEVMAVFERDSVMSMLGKEDSLVNVEGQSMLAVLGREEGEGLVKLGQEVAVLLAPELEERLLHSRAAKEAATQTDAQLGQADNDNGSRLRRNRGQGVQKTVGERPQWGAHRSNAQYVKQSDKEPLIARHQRLTRLSRISRHGQQQQKSSGSQGRRRGRGADSTEDSDRSPPARSETKRSSSLTKCFQPQRLHQRVRQGSDYDSRSPSPQPHPKTAPSSCPPLAQVSATPQLKPSRHSCPQLGPRQPACPPPAPPPRNCPSPPVPAVLRRLQQSELTPVNNLSTSVSNKPEELFIKTQLSQQMVESLEFPSRPIEPSLHGPPVRLLKRDTVASGNLQNSVTDSSDLLSQLSTLRKGLLIKQKEWESRSQTPCSDM